MKQRRRRSHLPGRAKVSREADRLRIAADLTDVALPSDEFEADAVSLVVRSGAVSFILDQLSVNDSARVNARVEIRMPFESFMQLRETTKIEPFASGFRKWMDQYPASDAMRKLEDDPRGGRVVRRAQLARLSHVGTDAEINFYALSAALMSEVIRGDVGNAVSVPIAGVVRVTMTIEVLAHVVRMCDTIADQIVPAMKEGLEGAE